MSMQSEGGKARAKKLSASRRSEISAIAANARWAGVPRESRTMPCSSQISPHCLKEIVVVVTSEAQAHRTILKLNWNILHDHERIYGFVCPQCVKAHAPGAERIVVPPWLRNGAANQSKLRDQVAENEFEAQCGCARCEERIQEDLDAER